MANVEERLRVTLTPLAKRRRICEHCNRDLSIKLYREHKRLYYAVSSMSWVKEKCDEQELSSSDITSLDECELTVAPISTENHSCDESDKLCWDEHDESPALHEDAEALGLVHDGSC